MPQGNVLAKLFGSEARVRLLRLFLLNPIEVFDIGSIQARIRVPSAVSSKELRSLLEIGFIRRGTRVVTTNLKKGKTVRKKLSGYQLVRGFPYINELSGFLASNIPSAREKLAGGMKGAGKIVLLVIAGRLLGRETAHVDAFVVGDTLKKLKIEKILSAIEADMGRELVYAIMPTKEFQYRFGMQDRFIKDLFDNPHELLINKLGIG